MLGDDDETEKSLEKINNEKIIKEIIYSLDFMEQYIYRMKERKLRKKYNLMKKYKKTKKKQIKWWTK